MEDIRRYLTLPNVLILMATDIDMLHNVFTQSFADAFQVDLINNVIGVNDVIVSSEKYLSKMVPPSHKIYLPMSNDMIRSYSDRLQIEFIDDLSGENLLIKGESFQSRILTFLFNKTHFFFSAHESYCNNIIPQTLRGLTYFLNMISDMPDVPDNRNDNESYIDFLIRQAEILEKNLGTFEAYFIHEWVPAKLH